jgi:hypothetical protein
MQGFKSSTGTFYLGNKETSAVSIWHGWFPANSATRLHSTDGSAMNGTLLVNMVQGSKTCLMWITHRFRQVGPLNSDKGSDNFMPRWVERSFWRLAQFSSCPFRGPYPCWDMICETLQTLCPLWKRWSSVTTKPRKSTLHDGKNQAPEHPELEESLLRVSNLCTLYPHHF